MISKLYKKNHAKALFTCAALNQSGCPKGSPNCPKEVRDCFSDGQRRQRRW